MKVFMVHKGGIDRNGNLRYKVYGANTESGKPLLAAELQEILGGRALLDGYGITTQQDPFALQGRIGATDKMFDFS